MLVDFWADDIVLGFASMWGFETRWLVSCITSLIHFEQLDVYWYYHRRSRWSDDPKLLLACRPRGEHEDTNPGSTSETHGAKPG